MLNKKAILSTATLCFIVWVLYSLESGQYNIKKILIGAIVSIISAVISAPFLVKEDAFWIFNWKRLRAVMALVPICVVSAVRTNWNVAKMALSKEIKIKPGIVKIQTEITSDYGLATLSNCINLNAGTIIMDIIEKRGKCFLYVHCIDVKSKNIKEASKLIKGNFEQWIRRSFK